LIRRRYSARLTDDQQDRLLASLLDLGRDHPHVAERLLRHFLGMAPPARDDAPQRDDGATMMVEKAVREMIVRQRGA
jgi:hypothetical protein